MTTKVEAVYEHGVLRPRQPLPLDDGTKVDVLVLSDEASTAKKTGRRPSRQETPAEILAEIAALSVDHGVETSSRDHDQVLYGKAK
jgi:predicted DNA-binding antitoxin AbrB/MazE fold protein